MGRSDRWTTPRYYEVACTSAEGERSDRSQQLQECLRHVAVSSEKPKNLLNFIDCAREFILEASDGGKYQLHIVSFTLNTTWGCLQLSRLLQGVDFNENDVKKELAKAIIHEIPVYPEDERSAIELQRIYLSLLDDGFEMEIDGSRKTYELAQVSTFTASQRSVDEATGEVASVQPADMLVNLARQAERERELAEAARVLANLRHAIEQLQEGLDCGDPDERVLQKCLTDNSILFGLDYKRVIPEHRLGDDYVMDYALQKTGGLLDLVEIERSGHLLFTKKGDPRSTLTHAEQQVMDWLQWIEENHHYATGKLPGLMRPRGYVVIGRSSTLSEANRKKLDRRNSTWGDSLTILTFDDLLDQAKNVLRLLEGDSASRAGN